MRKRITAMLLAIALLCALLPATLLTASAENLSGTYGENLTWVLDADTETLTISGTGTMPNGSLDDIPWLSLKDSIKYVYIESGVTSIGEYAFYDCTALINVVIPNSVKSIEAYAFYSCAGLFEIIIPDSVTSIGDFAFAYCNKLKSINIPNALTNIGYSAFCNAKELSSIFIPASVSNIGDSAFNYCSLSDGIRVDDSNPYFCGMNNSLYSKDKTVLICACPVGAESFIIPNSVTTIANGAFSGREGLTSVTIPNSVRTIGEAAFSSCQELASINIPDGVLAIGAGAFCFCYDLNDIIIPDSVTEIGNAAFEHTRYYDDETNWSGEALYIGKHLIKVNESTSGEFVVREGTITIAGGAFYNLQELSSITISDSVKSIGDSAFSYCTKLSNITVPDSTISIGDHAFSNCSKLTTVYLGDSMTSIGEMAFFDCCSLSSINFPDSMKRIGADAFRDCSKLIEVILPNAFTSLGEGVFYGCTNLNRVSLGNSITMIGEFAFCDCTALSFIVIPNSVTTIGEYAFNNCEELSALTIPDGVTSIGGFAFSGCSMLTDVDLPDCLTSLGDSAFSDCSSIKSITIPDGIILIDTATFAGCSSLEKVELPDTLTTIEAGAFLNCYNLSRVILPDSLEYIGFVSFSHCGLTSLTIPSRVSYIGTSAFSGCKYLREFKVAEENHVFCAEDGILFTKDKSTLRYYPAGKLGGEYTVPQGVSLIATDAFSFNCYLNSVTISDSVTCIEDSAFAQCTGLRQISIPDSVNRIGFWAFINCSNLSNVIIPNNVSVIESFTFYGCTELTSISIPVSVTTIEWRAFQECTSLSHVYFEGTEEEWNRIAIDVYNECLTNATIHFESHIHKYSDSIVTAPTCTGQGFTTHICACGDSFDDTYVDAMGHNYVYGVCTRCGEKDPDYKPTAPAIEFNDIPANAWYVDAVDFAVENGLMNGVGNGKFDPEGSMTRAMLVTVLWRYEGSPKTGTNTFTDVQNGQWYTDAVAWAAAEGIVGGVGDGKFEPDGNITREQMATILFRYANKKGFDTSKRGNLSSFPDAFKVSSYAKDALSWTVAEGIINGSDGYLLPQGDATRAQVSAILMRYIKNIADVK